MHTRNSNVTVALCLSTSSILKFQYFNYSNEGDAISTYACWGLYSFVLNSSLRMALQCQDM